jgi:predicted ABC-type ATPase
LDRQLWVSDGGHAVSPEYTLARAPRTFKLLPRAFALADGAFVIDNSDEARLVLKKENSILYRAGRFRITIDMFLKDTFPC